MTLARKLLLIAAASAIAVVGGFLAYRALAPGEAPLGPAPDIRLPDLAGQERSLAEWRGKLLLINFWATWCTPCLHETPMLKQMQERYAARGLQIVGPALDDPEAVRNLAPQLGINYPVLIGDTAIVKAMQALGDRLGALPFSVLVSPDGQILLRKHGEFQGDELESILKKQLPYTP